jgi:hypothetical protein
MMTGDVPLGATPELTCMNDGWGIMIKGVGLFTKNEIEIILKKS